MKLLYKKTIIHLLTVIAGGYMLYYLVWRAMETLNPVAMVFSIILLVAEVQGIINFFLFAMMTWNTQSKPTPRTLYGVSVDVFVPTYDEDVTVLEATLVGCMRMRMPHKTYILDDGRRSEVRELAQRIGCGYLTREDNKHAKAGNLNAALPQTDGEFIVVLDADMVPQPDYLEKTLGYFRDEKVAVVQMPQEFYNLDSMQHNKKGSYWHEQQLFYHVIQPGKNNIDAAFWCGSPSIVRRAALLDIGGVATDSITEDFLTSIRLNARGWKIRFHHEALAFGIAPQSFHAFSVQRLRWAQGSMKILKSRDNPLLKRGLTLRQRLSHFAAVFTYFDAYQKLIYILTPVILLTTGLMPLKPDTGLVFLWHWLPYFALTMVTNIAVGRGFFEYFSVEKFNTLKMVTFIRASFSLIWSRGKFRVTPKKAEQTQKRKDRRELRVHFVILAVIAAAVVYGAVNAIFRFGQPYESTAALAVALFWAVFNGSVIVMALYEVLKRMYARQDYRFAVALRGRATGKDGCRYNVQIGDISRGGASFVMDGGIQIAKNTDIDIELPDGMIRVPGSIVFERESKDGRRRAGFQFTQMSNAKRERLYNFLFVTEPRRLFEAGELTPRSGRAAALAEQTRTAG